jgi:hypothetical protein
MRSIEESKSSVSIVSEEEKKESTGQNKLNLG